MKDSNNNPEWKTENLWIIPFILIVMGITSAIMAYTATDTRLILNEIMQITGLSELASYMLVLVSSATIATTGAMAIVSLINFDIG